ncbi:MAG TPA: ferrous iron transport protein B, partial [Firmicutes bacterium]|nr:ferrous iron transport protein B [Bacillota bacterium]
MKRQGDTHASTTVQHGHTVATGVAPVTRKLVAALVGNPNSGKTTLFNALTGLRHKVGNYPGVTVERKEGTFRHNGCEFSMIDLPGTYSLCAVSEDERTVRDLLLNLIPGEREVDLVVVVVDASHLERHLYLATQVMDLGFPMVVALTMNDEARQLGRGVDAAALGRGLGVPVVEVLAPRGRGIGELKVAMEEQIGGDAVPPDWKLGESLLAEIDRLADLIGKHLPGKQNARRHLALQLLTDTDHEHPLMQIDELNLATAGLVQRLNENIPNWREAEAHGRYVWINQATAKSRTSLPYKPSRSDGADRYVTHPVWGMVIFCVVMAVMFQSIFTWAGPFMDGIEWFFGWLGEIVATWLPAGPLRGLVVDGIIGGVGGVIVFLPQILILFLFIVLLEDSGYMARAAFLMNRHMRRAGLHGRSFVPLLSGFACAIPALMSARTIPDRRDRLITMLVIPLVSCSARLPVYALIIAAFVPAIPVFKGLDLFTLQGLTLLSLYFFSIAAAVTTAFVLRKSMFKGQVQPFIMELPPYRWPNLKTVLATIWERGRLFLTQAGTIILAVNVLLWFLLSYPVDPQITGEYDQLRRTAAVELSGEALDAQVASLDTEESSKQLAHSFGGRMGKVMEPALRPLG